MDKDEKASAGVPKFQRRLMMIMMIIMMMMVMIMMVVMIRMMIVMMIMRTMPYDDDDDADDVYDHKSNSYIAAGAAPGASVSCFFFLALWSRPFGPGSLVLAWATELPRASLSQESS